MFPKRIARVPPRERSAADSVSSTVETTAMSLRPIRLYFPIPAAQDRMIFGMPTGRLWQIAETIVALDKPPTILSRVAATRIIFLLT